MEERGDVEEKYGGGGVEEGEKREEVGVKWGGE